MRSGIEEKIAIKSVNSVLSLRTTDEIFSTLDLAMIDLQDLPQGSTGLVHISEVADNYVKDINDHLKVGDTVEVKVINVEKDGKIGLSIKKAIDRPEGEQKPAYTPRPRQGRGNDNRSRYTKKFQKHYYKKL